MTKKVQRPTDCEQLSDSGLVPFHEVTAFAAAHVKDLATSSTRAGTWGTVSKGGMSELRNENRLHPIVETLESDDLRLLALFYTHFRSEVVCRKRRQGIRREIIMGSSQCSTTLSTSPARLLAGRSWTSSGSMLGTLLRLFVRRWVPIPRKFL